MQDHILFNCLPQQYKNRNVWEILSQTHLGRTITTSLTRWYIGKTCLDIRTFKPYFIVKSVFLLRSKYEVSLHFYLNTEKLEFLFWTNFKYLRHYYKIMFLLLIFYGIALLKNKNTHFERLSSSSSSSCQSTVSLWCEFLDIEGH